MKTPSVSVVMPCLNAEATLRQSVESVLAQCFTDFELVIVDDGSKDGSVALAQALAERDSRIRVICQANAGPAPARNRGIAQSRGALLAFIDADDRWTPDLLARHVIHFRDNPDSGVAFARVLFFDSTMTVSGRTSAAIDRLTLVDVLGENPVCTTSNLVARYKVFAEIGGFDPELTHGEGQEWVARALAMTDWQVRGLSWVLVHYRTSLGDLSADLGRMDEGWAGVMRRVHGYAPKEADAAEPQARALFNAYLTRRALRAGQASASLRPLLRAWWASPRALLTHQPARTV